MKHLVSDAEVKAAKAALDRFASAAKRDQPIPETIIRHMLEDAAMVRTGMRSTAEPHSR